MDALANYFNSLFDQKELIDLQPNRIEPKWRNNRGGDARISNRIDRFLVAEHLMDRFLQVRQWVGSGGASDHFPFFLELKKGPIKPTSPMKFNKIWLKDESFISLIYPR